MKLSPYGLAATLFLLGAPVLAATRAAILLELFTSEGCSSCPPADTLLDELDRTQPFSNAELIILSEHVDYWDQLGWKDPYSSAIFSARQNEYAAHFKAEGVYTPQLVIDGALEAVGSDRDQIRRAVGKAVAQSKLPIAVQISRAGSAGAVHVALSPPAAVSAGDVYVVLAKNHVTSYVAHGENAHRTLSHTAVAYQIVKLARHQSSIDLQATEGQTRVIAYVQDPATGRIIAVAQGIL